MLHFAEVSQGTRTENNVNRVRWGGVIQVEKVLHGCKSYKKNLINFGLSMDL